MCVKSKDTCINCLHPTKSPRAVVTIPFPACLQILTSVQAFPLTVSSWLILLGTTQWMVLIWACFSVKDREGKHNTEPSTVLSKPGSYAGWLLVWRNQSLVLGWASPCCSSPASEEPLHRYSFSFSPSLVSFFLVQSSFLLHYSSPPHLCSFFPMFILTRLSFAPRHEFSFPYFL